MIMVSEQDDTATASDEQKLLGQLIPQDLSQEQKAGDTVVLHDRDAFVLLHAGRGVFAEACKPLAKKLMCGFLGKAHQGESLGGAAASESDGLTVVAITRSLEVEP
jgi:hypothetical protein